MTDGRTPAERNGLEQELKYRLRDAEHAARYASTKALGLLRATGRPRQVQIEDRYLDTADRRLAVAGYAARLRRGPAMTILSVKSAGASGSALHRRDELEGPADLSLDPHAWPSSAARALVLEHAGDAPLREIVTIRQLRRTRTLVDEAGEVEMSVDDVEVVHEGRVIERFLELEVELRRGGPEVLEGVMAALRLDDALAPVTTSKLERALELTGARRTGRARTMPARAAGAPGGATATLAAPAIETGGPTEPAASQPAPTAGTAGVSSRGAGAGAGSSPGEALPGTEGRQGAEGSRGAEGSQGAGTSQGAEGSRGAEGSPGAAGSRGAEGSQGAGTSQGADASQGAAGSQGAAARPGSTGSGAPAGSGSAGAAPAIAPPGRVEPSRLVVGKTPGITGDDILGEAGRKILRFHLARMLAKEAGTRSGEEIEDLHGMRVATRRMRAAWRVYGDAFRLGRTRRLRVRLREVAGRLGAVRDLDVLIDGLEAYRASLPASQATALAPLVTAWTAERDAARVLLLHALDAPWYARFVEEYRAFVVTEGAGVRPAVSPIEPHRVRDTAGSRIWRSYEQVRAYEPVLRWSDIETLHELRIASKWLRYTMEFFREALGPEIDSCISKVVALQDHLGLLHDADVTIALTRQFLVERSSSLSTVQVEAIGDYLRGRERELERLRRTVGVPWRGVTGIPFRRLLGRAVSAL